MGYQGGQGFCRGQVLSTTLLHPPHVETNQECYYVQPLILNNKSHIQSYYRVKDTRSVTVLVKINREREKVPHLLQGHFFTGAELFENLIK